MDLNHIKGIGEKTVSYLHNASIYSVEDLLRFYPYRYQILSPSLLEETSLEEVVTINVIVSQVPQVSYIKRNLNALRFVCESNGKRIRVTIFNRAFLKRNLVVGKKISLTGKYNAKSNTFTANDIKFSWLDDAKIIPVYHSIKGIRPITLEKLIDEALQNNLQLEDTLPLELKEKYRLISISDALLKIHKPKSKEDVKQARRRIIYEELFEFMFKIQYLKQLKHESVGQTKHFDQKKLDCFIESLPFSLTNDQRKAVDDGLKDLESSRCMNRLLLGDVGSGKTIVATILLYANALAGYQTAFLAPTEILAEQHFRSIRGLLADSSLEIDLMVGSLSKKEKENILERCQSGQIDVLIGTHALLNENLFFNRLGFIITDEQHRFGVNQRDKLKSKAVAPDMLFMSATPIPRTYALTIYGDMDTSIIKEKPKGRKDIITKVVKEKDLREVLLKVLEEIKLGHQVYVVAPMIEESEESTLKNVELLREKFDLAYHGKIPMGVLHGKMKKDQKEEVMHDFKIGKSKILISTTVVEVGVDVSLATVMIIFNADRFGLATLHQLRGRVGRSDLQSYCYLICNEDKERLHVLEESNDGFYISEKDFDFRGEGDLFGVKQSGDMSFSLADIRRDYDILMVAKEDAEEYVVKKMYNGSQHFKEIIEKIDFTN